MQKYMEDRSLKTKYPKVWERRHVRYTPMPAAEQKPFYDFVKRIFDMCASAIALVLIWWVILIAAIAIKIEDGGPVIFTQTRIGKDGKMFRMYKLRSMRPNSEKLKKELLKKNELDGPAFKLENDPRITKVGRFIRKYSIDELPQLVNILRSEMSIVGPRPPLGHEVMEYDEFAMRRLTVKPGLTCYWQCSGRSNLNFKEWMQMDNKYIDERGIRTDIKIIFKTIPAVFRSDGAY